MWPPCSSLSQDHNLFAMSRSCTCVKTGSDNINEGASLIKVYRKRGMYFQLKHTDWALTSRTPVGPETIIHSLCPRESAVRLPVTPLPGAVRLLPPGPALVMVTRTCQPRELHTQTCAHTVTRHSPPPTFIPSPHTKGPLTFLQQQPHHHELPCTCGHRRGAWEASWALAPSPWPVPTPQHGAQRPPGSHAPPPLQLCTCESPHLKHTPCLFPGCVLQPPGSSSPHTPGFTPTPHLLQGPLSCLLFFSWASQLHAPHSSRSMHLVILLVISTLGAEPVGFALGPPGPLTEREVGD